MAQALPGPLGRDDNPLGACQRLCSRARDGLGSLYDQVPDPSALEEWDCGGARPGRTAACVWVLLPGFSRAGFCPGSPLPQTFVLTGNVVLLEGGASRERGRAGGTPGTSVGFDCPGGQLRSHLGSSQGWLSVQGGATKHSNEIRWHVVDTVICLR